MPQVLITIDTELSASRQERGLALEENFRQSFVGGTNRGDFGVPWLMSRMEERGIRGVFFVDPMPGLIHGPGIVARMVEPIIARGHEVQIHIHSEWLQWARDSPVEDRTGRNIGDFSLEDQIALIGWASDALVAAGAPPPNAFRAGNFGANEDTLRALDVLGIRWDSSYNADYAASPCRITLSPGTIDPVQIGNVCEVPVAGIWDLPGRFRPAQVCALSALEMRMALNHAVQSGAHSFIAVTHGFEMLSRDRQRPNRMVMRRFTALCDGIAGRKALVPAGFSDLAPPPATPSIVPRGRLAPSRLRTWARMGEQAVATWRYERRLRPL